MTFEEDKRELTVADKLTDSIQSLEYQIKMLNHFITRLRTDEITPPIKPEGQFTADPLGTLLVSTPPRIHDCACSLEGMISDLHELLICGWPGPVGGMTGPVGGMKGKKL